MGLFEYQIGTTLLNLINLEDLLSELGSEVHAPASTFQPFAELRKAASGKVLGVGFPSASWSWAYLSRNQRDLLRAYCPNASANVFIRTRLQDNGGEYKTYQAYLYWPENEEMDGDTYLNFTLRFAYLVEQP